MGGRTTLAEALGVWPSGLAWIDHSRRIIGCDGRRDGSCWALLLIGGRGDGIARMKVQMVVVGGCREASDLLACVGEEVDGRRGRRRTVAGSVGRWMRLVGGDGVLWSCWIGRTLVMEAVWSSSLRALLDRDEDADGWRDGSVCGRRDGWLRLAVGGLAGKPIASSHGCRLEEDD
ncbi:hypothetical protein ACLOJK_018112 [Asimina triloba]